MVRLVGEPRSLAFTPRDHLDLAGPLIDMERGAKLSGARFAYLKGALVMLELALVARAGEAAEPRLHARDPAVLVRERALYGTGFLPDTEQQIYTLDQDELTWSAPPRSLWPRCTTAR